MNKAFRTNLIHLLARYELGQNELAKELGVAPSTVSDWVSGKKFPHQRSIEKICNHFDVEQDELLTYSTKEQWIDKEVIAAYHNLPDRDREIVNFILGIKQ